MSFSQLWRLQVQDHGDIDLVFDRAWTAYLFSVFARQRERAQIPFMRAPPSRSEHIAKALPPNTITRGLRISTYEFWGDTFRP